MKCGTCSKPHWVDAANGFVPENAMLGGNNHGEIEYIARANHNGNVIPGKLVVSRGGVVIFFLGEELLLSEYQVLVHCCKKLYWRSACGTDVPSDAVVGGNYGQETLYVGRVKHQDLFTLGYVRKSLQGCLVIYDGKEQVFREYHVIVTP